MPGNPQTFTIYASHGRVYAENVSGKLVDLGAIHNVGNTFRYVLDADNVSGEPAQSVEGALADIRSQVTFLYLDGQFTALEDARAQARLTPESPHVTIAFRESDRPD